MIVSINPALFNHNDEAIQVSLSKIVSLFLEKRFIWDLDNIDALFINSSAEFSLEESLLYKNFLSSYQQDKLLTLKDEVIQLSAYQTDVHNKYLSKLNIGLNNEEVHPNNAYQILNLDSMVIVENGINDWSFICGLVDKYRNNKKRKSIYRLIQHAIDDNRLKPQHAGGIGMIWNILEDLGRREYMSIEKCKVFVLFDSDRNDCKILNQEQKILIRNLKRNDKIDDVVNALYCEEDIVLWHMLYKRSIENYLPLRLLEETNKIPVNLLNGLRGLPNNQLDFHKYDEVEFRKYGIDVKADFPALFKSQWPKEGLDLLCDHHKCKIELPNGTLEDVTEPEEILLKIARII